MRKTEGIEGNREWTQYGFRFKGKNHAIVSQRTWNDEHSNPWWYTFHLEGRGKDDPLHTIENAPLSRNQAIKLAREYIKRFIANN